MKRFFTVLSITLHGLSYAQEGFKFAYSDSEYNVYIKEEGDNEAWVNYEKKIKTYKNKQGKYVRAGGGRLLSLDKYNCKDKTSSTKAIIQYGKNGKVESQVDYGYFTNKGSIVPNTNGELIFDIICGNKNYPEDDYKNGFEEGYIDVMCDEYILKAQVERGKSEVSANDTDCPYLDNIPFVLFQKDISKIYGYDYFSAGYDKGMEMGKNRIRKKIK